MSPRTGPDRRAVITGVGVVAPGAIGTKAFWSMLADGRSATRIITAFDPTGHRSQLAGECDFDPAAQGLSLSQTRRLDRTAQFAVVAGREAVFGAGLDLSELDPSRVAIAVGSSVGTAHRTVGSTLDNQGLHGAARAGPAGEHRPADSMSAELAALVGAQGPEVTLSTGSTSGLDSIGYAAEMVTEGIVDVVLAGGTEAPISPVMVGCFDAIRASSGRNDDPAHACRPFDRSRDGIVLAEGAALLVVEDLRHARRRGAHVFAEVAAFASRCDVDRVGHLDWGGRELAAAITAAMRRAKVEPSAIDYVNAHGSAGQHDDVYETRAFKRSLGSHAYRVPISGFKSMLGHALCASGSLDVAGCLLAFAEDLIAPTANLHDPDPRCDLDFVPLVARQRRVGTVLTVCSGFEGFQSAMVLRRVDR
jgi:act minimal PKS ketosynthase (KS/KS alpha)